MKILTKRRKNWLLILASIASIYFIINLRYESPSQQARNGSGDDLPQWLLSGATIENFNQDGALTSRLLSEHTAFYAATDSIKLTKPVLQYYENQQPSWRAQANYGVGHNDMATLALSENVIMQNETSKQTISTQWLRSDFNKNLLKTDKAVTIASPHAIAKATGMEGNWRDKTLKLLNDVHVEITPPR